MMKKLGWFVILIASALVVPPQALAGKYFDKVEMVAAEVVPGNRGGRISWQNFEQGRMEVLISDLDGYVVRHLPGRDVESGTNSADWDGLDDDGRPVADGAYLPLLRFTSRLGAVQFYDPARSGWGARLKVEDLAFDGQNIRFSLPGPALCLLRAGELPGGPCYKTVLQWKPFAAGSHTVEWDGLDANRTARVWKFDGFRLDMDAMALPQNSFLVTGSSTQVVRPAAETERIGLFPPAEKGIFIHSLHSRWACRDPKIRAKIVSGLSFFGKRIKGRYLVIEVTAASEREKAMIEREGFELYAFMAGKFLGEIKADKLPARIRVATGSLKPGRRLLTVNLRTIEDHVGTWSCEVVK